MSSHGCRCGNRHRCFVHTYNFAHKFIPMLQALEIPDAEAAVEKEWEKLEKIPAWQLTKSQKQKKSR